MLGDKIEFLLDKRNVNAKFTKKNNIYTFRKKILRVTQVKLMMIN